MQITKAHTLERQDAITAAKTRGGLCLREPAAPLTIEMMSSFYHNIL
jgi:hypothetical protein